MQRILRKIHGINILSSHTPSQGSLSSVKLEFDHISSQSEKDFLYSSFESATQSPESPAQQINSFRMLQMSYSLENFLLRKLSSYKRFSGEGLESISPSLYTMLETQYKQSSNSSVIIETTHRGKLAILSSIGNFPLRNLFYIIKGNPSFTHTYNKEFFYFGDEDPIGEHINTERPEFKGLEISILENPSHLEVNGPVGVGKTRSKLDRGRETMFIELHGDAAMAQGVVYETLQLAKLPEYSVNGTLHIIMNNQLGFTTESNQGKSSRYCTDVFKIIECPIVHVNAQDIEMVNKISKLAVEYRNLFHNDFCIDLIGYRRYGHNEGDEPAISNPKMYHVIRNILKPSIEHYSKHLIENKVISEEGILKIKNEYEVILEKEFELAHEEHLKKDEKGNIEIPTFKKQWKNMSLFHDNHEVNSGFSKEKLKEIGLASISVPEEFKLHPIINRHIANRKERLEKGEIDWSTAEALALGSLLQEGYHIRFSGEDTIRGTFTQRHGGIWCQNTQNLHIPLSALKPGKFDLINSPLIELATVGFEYGYSQDHPNNLVIWEAEYGDFVNMAEPIIDIYIRCGESKWLKQSGLVLLLPHGQEGYGPEHSSAYLERFFCMINDPLATQLNFELYNLVIASNYFHVLRRQMMRKFRRPLVIGTPKSGLRNKFGNSEIEEFEEGTQFRPVLHEKVNGGSETLVMANGKIYLDVMSKFGDRSFGICLVEELAPFPLEEIKKVYNEGGYQRIVWVEEEPYNIGIFKFVENYLTEISEKVFSESRPPMSAVTPTSPVLFEEEVEDLFNRISRWL